MHCLACDVMLSDYEATRKHKQTGEYIELCNNCFHPLDGVVPVVERYDLLTQKDVEKDDS